MFKGINNILIWQNVSFYEQEGRQDSKTWVQPKKKFGHQTAILVITHYFEGDSWLLVSVPATGCLGYLLLLFTIRSYDNTDILHYLLSVGSQSSRSL